jgi:hypothetical protein
VDAEKQMDVETAVEANSDSLRGGVLGTDVRPLEGKVAEVMSKLSIRGNGLSFEREVPDSLVLKIMRLVLTGDMGVTIGANNASVVEGAERKESLAEFYRRASPSKYPEKLTTIGAYLQQVLGRQSFTPDELRGQFRGVNEAPPANMPRDFKIAMGEGWIAEEHDQPGQFFTTRSGLEVVEVGFGPGASRKSIRPRRRRKASSSPQNDGSTDGE